jgi:polyisoprenyl-phosphate glycosyltransferase
MRHEDKQTMKLSVVIPIYNEEAVIPQLIIRLSDMIQAFSQRFQVPSSEIEILLVNDGSRDRSFEMLRSLCTTRPRFKLINLARNFGHQYAITAGIELAVGQAVVVMDGDLQDPPEFILELYQKLQEGYDVVYALRAKRRGENWFKLHTASLFYKVLRGMVDTEIPLDAGDFRVMTRRVVDQFKQMQETHRFVRGMVSWVGFRQTGLSYFRDKRFAGQTKFSLFKMIRFALDGITSFTTIPLRLSSCLGAATAFAGFLYMVYIFYIKLFTTKTVTGWSSTVVIILFLSGVQLMSLGVIGEYIGRLYEETKRRPLYVIEGIYEKEPSGNPGQGTHSPSR